MSHEALKQYFEEVSYSKPGERSGAPCLAFLLYEKIRAGNRCAWTNLNGITQESYRGFSLNMI